MLSQERISFFYRLLAASQEACHDFFIQSEFIPESAEELQNALAAEVRRAEMDLYAEVAKLAESETCRVMQACYAQRYRELVGVPPEWRQEFAALLAEASINGRESVHAILGRLAALHAVKGDVELPLL